jgi:hypothetical protein
MSRKHRLVLVFSVMVGMFVFLPSVSAINVISIDPVEWDCSNPFVNVALAFTGGGEPEPYREIFGYRVTDGDGDVLVYSGFNHTWTPGTDPEVTTFSFILNAAPTQNPVTIEIIDWDINGNPTGATWSIETISPCAMNGNGNGNHNGWDNGNGNHNGAYGTNNGNHRGHN